MDLDLIPLNDQIGLLDRIGGELLEGSGMETEFPESDFKETE